MQKVGFWSHFWKFVRNIKKNVMGIVMFQCTDLELFTKDWWGEN